MSDIRFQKNYSAWIGTTYPVRPEGNSQPVQQQKDRQGSDFSAVLNRVRTNSLNFSKHALQRMDARQIEVSPELMEQMSGAVEKAKSKGVRDALILSGTTAFIVNVPSSTVVTMMNGGEMKDNIFTNIDGAVLL